MNLVERQGQEETNGWQIHNQYKNSSMYVHMKSSKEHIKEIQENFKNKNIPLDTRYGGLCIRFK